MDEDLSKVCRQGCGLPEEAHGEGKTVHPFDPVVPKSPSPKVEVEAQLPPSDPILRAVLLSKGLITVSDLQRAEQILATNGALVVRSPDAPG